METFAQYDPGEFFDELMEADGTPRPGAQLLVDKINSLRLPKPYSSKWELPLMSMVGRRGQKRSFPLILSRVSFPPMTGNT